MILAKQLELQDSNQGATPTPTPRSNLAKELEKYNRPTVEIQAPLSSKPVPAVVVSTQSASQTSVPDRSSSSSSGSNNNSDDSSLPIYAKLCKIKNNKNTSNKNRWFSDLCPQKQQQQHHHHRQQQQ